MRWVSKHHGPRQGLESVMKRDWHEGGMVGVVYFLAALKEHLRSRNKFQRDGGKCSETERV